MLRSGTLASFLRATILASAAWSTSSCISMENVCNEAISEKDEQATFETSVPEDVEDTSEEF